MNRRAFFLSVVLALVLGVTSTGVAQAGGPERIGDSYTDTFFDDFIWDLCGIETLTTVTERWTLKEFPDGSQILHVNRYFVPHDPRIPRERGAGTSFFAPDGTKTTVGSPTRVFATDGRGLILLDAGRVVFGEDITIRGHVESFDVDLASVYCP
ncbi:MAG: hypothetical protein H0U86_01565 [Chloroflexi bacterium]|nr:hypothetical protein [Chloroflexota bacterium]